MKAPAAAWIPVLALAVLGAPAVAPVAAQQEAGVVVELRYRPAPRAQIATWIEDADGRFLRTLSLSEATAYRGIGNRPGASQMNSGYHWPYGRREGVLPIWASRRAAAPGAKQFRRVIFQDRTSEGLASRTSNDHSVDDYFCLSFTNATTKRDALDAVSCASVFTSDKGRFLTEDDAGYSEPYEDPDTLLGSKVALSLDSLYPPRMDVVPCDPAATTCFDHPDVADFAEEARRVMPDIDAVTTATLPGSTMHSALFTLPAAWPAGTYYVWLEVNVEGDYNGAFNDTTFPTPSTPSGAWDSWALGYGYPYRGQPSIAYAVEVELGAKGRSIHVARDPAGASSWDFWEAGFGSLGPMTDMTDDPTGAPGSGADRLIAAEDGTRIEVIVDTLVDLQESEPDEDPWVDLMPMMDPASGAPDAEPDPADEPMRPNGEPPPDQDDPAQTTRPPEPDEPDVAEPDDDEPVVIVTPEASALVGAIEGLQLRVHSERKHAHEWIEASFVAPSSDVPLHGYDIRVSTSSITDEVSFIRNGRPAKTATEDAEGSVMLVLDPKTFPGDRIETEIGGLLPATKYWVAVRARDSLNRTGPLTVGTISTLDRRFTTVSPCLVATAAHGSAMAPEVRSLRRLRDRHLMTTRAGAWLVAKYYELGAPVAAFLREHDGLRASVRSLLEPLVWLASKVDAPNGRDASP